MVVCLGSLGRCVYSRRAHRPAWGQPLASPTVPLGAAMTPSESLTELVPDVASPPPPDIAHPGNGAGGNGLDHGTIDERALLAALQRMRWGDFSVRLPGDHT